MKRQHHNRLKRGFTLIEMLVVILILSILAALIIPKLVGRTDDAKIAAAKSDIATLSSSVEQFRLDNGRYPSSDEGVQVLRVRPSNAPSWKGPYLQKDIPNDPWGNQYVYQSPGPNGEDFLITCYGADGAPGGDGNNADITSND
jgi:general secretion pathway protein G